jgi:hypothetical protein
MANLIIDKGRLDTGNVSIGVERTIQQGSTINDPIVQLPPEVALPDEYPPMDKMEFEKFMNEELRIHIHEPSTEGEPMVIGLEVGAVPVHVIRGVPQMVKRKYVEILARCRSSFVRHWFTVAGTSVKNFQKTSSKSLMYPFVVEVDPSGAQGREWLSKILAEAK